MAGRSQLPSQSQPYRHHPQCQPHPQHHQQQQQDRVLQASYLIPSYQKALPHALLHECSGDYRLRKIEATCSCKISWGNLPSRLAERYSLLQMAFDAKRGNYLGALNLLRQYFIGHTALMPFRLTLLRPNGTQVTKKFPTCVDDCRLLMPGCDRFGRTVVDLAEAVVAAAAAADDERATATAARGDACQQLADQLMESGIRCLAVHASFVESEGAAAARKAEAEAAATEAALAAAIDAEAAVASAADTVAQCEIGRACVCALVEAAEATRLLERLGDDSRRQKRRIDFRLTPATQQQQQQQQQQQVPQQQQKSQPQCQANNHHRPASRDRKLHQQLMQQRRNQQHRRQQQQHHHQHQQQPQQHQKQRQQERQQHHNHPEESCATTLADVEAITFAESEYVDKPPSAQPLQPSRIPSAVYSPHSMEPELTCATITAGTLQQSQQFPESLLLCGIQPGAADALSALDRSDRRLKTVERRTGCRLELRQRRCFAPEAVGAATSQRLSYALQVVPLRADSRPLGCVNMLRKLLVGLDPSCQFCVVTASEAAAAAAAASAAAGAASTAVDYRSTTQAAATSTSVTRRRCCRSKSAMPSVVAAAASAATRRRRRPSAPPSQPSPTLPPPPPSGRTGPEAAVETCAGRLLRGTVADCLLGAAASAAATAEGAGGIEFQRWLVRLRDQVLGDALICVFRSLTSTEADARLLGEVIDGGETNDLDFDVDIDVDATSYGIVRDALHRTLLACAAERRASGLLGAFASLSPPELTTSASNASSSSGSTSSPTAVVRRRLARLTLTCWERLCAGAAALDCSADDGAALLVEAATSSVVAEVAAGQLTAATLAANNIDGLVRRRGRLPQRLRRPLSVLAVKRLLASQLEAAVSSRVTLAAALTQLAGSLVAEQVRGACTRAQLLMRLRLRAS